jgi:hypothetical protein
VSSHGDRWAAAVSRGDIEVEGNVALDRALGASGQPGAASTGFVVAVVGLCAAEPQP